MSPKQGIRRLTRGFLYLILIGVITVIVSFCAWRGIGKEGLSSGSSWARNWTRDGAESRRGRENEGKVLDENRKDVQGSLIKGSEDRLESIEDEGMMKGDIGERKERSMQQQDEEEYQDENAGNEFGSQKNEKVLHEKGEVTVQQNMSSSSETYRNSNAIMIGIGQRESGKKSSAFPRRKFLEDKHVCKGMWLEDCFWKVTDVISSFFQHPSPDVSYDIVEKNTLVFKRPGGRRKGKMQNWAKGIELSKINGRKREIRLKVIKGFAFGTHEHDNKLRSVTTKLNISSFRFGGLVLQPNACPKDFNTVSSVSMNASRIPWLAQFTNVYTSGTGVILVPIRKKRLSKNTWLAHAYEIAGGCCLSHWASLVGRTFTVDATKKPIPLLFSIGQHHGVTFHHVMKDMLPRVVSFWSLLTGLRGAKILLSVHEKARRTAKVAENLLEVLGWPVERTMTLDQYEFAPVKRLLVPAPHAQDIQRYSDCYSNYSSKLLRALIQPSNLQSKPQILLIDRASWRRKGKNPECKGLRCIGNLFQIKTALEINYGDQVSVAVTQGRKGNVLMRTVSQFQKASIVIGGHGAGFQNIMFMPPGGHVIHLGWKGKMWRMYEGQSKRYGMHFQNVITEGAKRSASNIMADVPLIVRLVGDILSSTESRSRTETL